MNLQQYKFVFIAIGLIGILLIASPVFADVINFPSSEPFSELYLLGPNKMATDIPFNIIVGQNYSLYLGVGNHLDSSAYYVCYIKLRNQTEPLPDKITKTPSSLKPICEYRLFIKNDHNITFPLNFSLSSASFYNNSSFLESVTFNDSIINLDGVTAFFDDADNAYYYQFFIELWAFEPTAKTLQYQDRFVYFWMNVTSST